MYTICMSSAHRSQKPSYPLELEIPTMWELGIEPQFSVRKIRDLKY